MRKIARIAILIIVAVFYHLGISGDLQIFKERRQVLMQKMGKGIGIVLAGEEYSGERFMVNPDFYYLTGVDYEPGAILILAPAVQL